jgi:uncharacterized membrane protein
MLARWAKWSHYVATMALTVGLIIAGARLADRFNLPLMHGWALAHGAIFPIFPLYWLIAYFSLLPLRRRLEIAQPEGAPRKRISLFAIFALLLGGLGFIVPIVGSIVAIIFGHLARYRIKVRNLTGSGIAICGLILGYLGLAYSIYVFWTVSAIASRVGR